MRKYTYTVTNPMGLCAHITGELTRTVQAMDSAVIISNADGSKTAPGEKLIPVLGLGIGNGEKITAAVEGGHEEENLARLKQFFQEKL